MTEEEQIRAYEESLDISIIHKQFISDIDKVLNKYDLRTINNGDVNSRTKKAVKLYNELNDISKKYYITEELQPRISELISDLFGKGMLDRFNIEVDGRATIKEIL